MALFTKSILSERESRDGVRISVMSKHTLADGVTEDPRITPDKDKYDEHLKILAPKLKLVGDLYKRGLSWEIFELRYLNQIRQYGSISVVQALALRALSQDVTLLCIEPVGENCHRRLLAEECFLYESRLHIEHH